MGHRTISVLVVVLVVLAGCSAAPVPGGPTSDPGGDATSTTTVSTAEVPNGTVEVHFVNVGQSVSTLVVGPTGETMLIDTGHYDDDGEYVLDYLQAHGIERIDYLVTSHADADHIGGHAAVIDYYETQADGVGAIYDPGIASSTQTYGDYLDAVEEHGVDLYETREGDSIPMAGVDVAVFGPSDPYLENEARNENSLVLKLTFGSTSFLFTGDAEDDQEAYLVDEYGSELGATVLKAGHHGSSSSSSGALLDAVDPKAVVVSSAYDSRYGHPHEEVLDRLAARAIPTYWTATHGDVVLESDGRTVGVKTQRAAPTDPTRLRDGDPVEPGTGGDVAQRAVIGGGDGGSTPAATTTATDGGSPAPDLQLVEVHADAEGDDRGNLNDEYVVLENAGSAPLDLSGWTLSDEADHSYTFPDGFELGTGEQVTVHVGSGTDIATDLYWGSDSPIWNNAGDTVTVTSDGGEVVIREEY